MGKIKNVFLRKSDKATVFYFTATLGGNMGLFLGVSYLTLCEFLDYGVRRIYHNMFPEKNDAKKDESIPG